MHTVLTLSQLTLQKLGREQIHSSIEWLRPSLRQMSYTSFMVVVKLLFVYRNLKSKNVIQFHLFLSLLMFLLTFFAILYFCNYVFIYYLII